MRILTTTENTANNKQAHVQWVNEHQAADRIGSSVSKLRQDRHKSRGLPYTKFGRSVRYSIVDIEDYMATHRIVASRN